MTWLEAAAIALAIVAVLVGARIIVWALTKAIDWFFDWIDHASTPAWLVACVILTVAAFAAFTTIIWTVLNLSSGHWQ